MWGRLHKIAGKSVLLLDVGMRHETTPTRRKEGRKEGGRRTRGATKMALLQGVRLSPAPFSTLTHYQIFTVAKLRPL